MSYDDIFGYDEYSDPFGFTPSRKSRKKMKRSTKYVAPGHTVVDYPNRRLNIYFPQSKEQFDKLRKKRRSNAAKKAATHRSPRTSYYTGEYTYAQRTALDKGTRAIYEKNIKRDYYEIGDMRALLKDSHWEEVCGHKRWMFDNKTLVKEFEKYQREYQRMY